MTVVAPNPSEVLTSCWVVSASTTSLFSSDVKKCSATTIRVRAYFEALVPSGRALRTGGRRQH